MLFRYGLLLNQSNIEPLLFIDEKTFKIHQVYVFRMCTLHL